MSKRRDPHKQRKANELAKHKKKQLEQSTKRELNDKAYREHQSRSVYYNRVKETLNRINSRPAFADHFFDPGLFYGLPVATLIVASINDSVKHNNKVQSLRDDTRTIEHDPNEIPNNYTVEK